MRQNRNLQKKYNFLKLNIGSGELPQIDYITPLSSYRDNYNYISILPISSMPDVSEDIQYCTERINDTDLSYGMSYSGIPPFDKQPEILFGASGEIPELLRKYYFLKYYLYYNPGKLDTFGNLPNIEWSAVSGYTEFDSMVEDIINNTVSSVNPPQSLNNNQVLDDFEREYEAFIAELRNKKNMPGLGSTYTPSVYFNDDEYDYSSGFSGQE